MDIRDIIDRGIKYRQNRYNRYCYKIYTIDKIDIGIKDRHIIYNRYRHNRSNRYRYKR